MVGLLIIFLVSWLLLHFLDKTSIEGLGLLPKSERIKNNSFGLLISIICCLIYFGSLILLSKSSLKIAWTVKGQREIKMGKISYENGVPSLKQVETVIGKDN